MHAESGYYLRESSLLSFTHWLLCHSWRVIRTVITTTWTALFYTAASVPVLRLPQALLLLCLPCLSCLTLPIGCFSGTAVALLQNLLRLHHTTAQWLCWLTYYSLGVTSTIASRRTYSVIHRAALLMLFSPRNFFPWEFSQPCGTGRGDVFDEHQHLF